MDDDDLCYLSAVEALSLFRGRKLSPVEHTAAILRRAEALSETVNPFADRYFDEAMAGAKAAEVAYAKRDGRPRPLEGLPLAVKDSSAIQGRRSTLGSLINKDRVANRTDPAIDRLLRAGANLFARTTSPEFGWLFTCHSRFWGVTRNPWRLDVTPGGSSGGSAAALAAGAATLTTGGDSTGSIRQPASQCGVVGYKPPFGRIPQSPSASFDSYSQIGPMTRTVGDAALMTNVMAGLHALDHTSLPKTDRLPLDAEGVAGLKVAVSMDLGCFEVVEEVRRQTRAALAALESAGATVEDVDLGDLSEAVRLAHGAQEVIFAGVLEENLVDHGDVVSDYVAELAETARSFGPDDFRAALTVAGEVWHDRLGPVFRAFDVLICPTVSCPEIPAENWQKDEILVNGRPMTDTDMAMTALFNMFSRCPVLAVPSGRTEAGLPTGLQIVGRPYDDATVFRAAYALQRARPWLDCAARRPSFAAMSAGARSVRRS